MTYSFCATNANVFWLSECLLPMSGQIINKKKRDKEKLGIEG